MSVLGILDSVFNGFNTGLQVADNAYNRAFLGEQAEIQRGFNHDEAQLAYERALQADSTKYQRQVQDLTRAGLNPMLAVQQSAGSVNSSPASASIPSGSQVRFGNIDALAAVRFEMESKMLDAQVANIDADTAKKRAETEGQENENRLFRDTEELQRVLLGDEHDRNQWEKSIGLRGVQVKEDNQRMLEEQAKHYNDYLDRQSDYIHELKLSEDVKRVMYRANARESRQNAAYKAAMLEVDRQYREASTDTERERADLLKIESRIKNGIYTPEYISALCKEAKADSEYHEIMLQYYKGDYSAASKSLQKVFKNLEHKGAWSFEFGRGIGDSNRAASVLPATN